MAHITSQTSGNLRNDSSSMLQTPTWYEHSRGPLKRYNLFYRPIFPIATRIIHGSALSF
ncbi:hypothetical protein SERLA73DRAFT_176841 [Serpula lacrymans var. lacrymans S7.3]|uniref:Uncharacterized protein n=1 Tax=Serpula lacrymans var. lacrymans (strain S7.3) TaxID=936435 RepID=F8PQ61_SERL3|nr:hypothetical protein SERLA73DRAFT_176841 [Serpula lacrymans var. lacrymans S7.3]